MAINKSPLEDNPLKPIKGSLLKKSAKEKKDFEVPKITPLRGDFKTDIKMEKPELETSTLYLEREDKGDEVGENRFVPVDKREMETIIDNVASEDEKKQIKESDVLLPGAAKPFSAQVAYGSPKQEFEPLKTGLATLHKFNHGLATMTMTGVRAFSEFLSKPVDWDKREEELEENMTRTLPVAGGEDIKLEPSEIQVDVRKFAEKVITGEWNPYVREAKKKLWNKFGREVSEESKQIIDVMNKEHQRIAAPIHDSEPGISNWNEFLYSSASAGISTGTALGISTITGNPQSGAAFLSAMESSQSYNEARDQGLSPTEALRASFQEGGGTFLLETLGLDSLASSTTKGLLSKGLSMAKGAGMETGTEVLQTWWQNLVAKNEYDEARNVFDGTVDTAIATLPSSLLFSAGSQGYAMRQQNKAISEIQEKSGLNRKDATKVFREIQQIGSIVRSGMEDKAKSKFDIGLSLDDSSGDVYDRIPRNIKDKALESTDESEFENYLDEEEAEILRNEEIGISEAYNTVNGLESEETRIGGKLRSMKEQGFSDREILKEKIDEDLDRYEQDSEKARREAINEVNKKTNKAQEINQKDEFQKYIEEQFEGEELTAFEENFQESEARVLAEMEESEAGQKVLQEGEEFVSNEGYPDWIPNELRNEETLNKVITHLKNNTTPNRNASNQRALYRAATREVLNRTGLTDEQIAAVESYMLPESSNLEKSLPEQETPADVEEQYLKERRNIEQKLPRKWLTPREASVQIRKAKKKGQKIGARKERQRLKKEFENKTKTAEEIRKDIRDYANEHLSIRGRGRLLTKVKNVSAGKTEAANRKILGEAINFMDRIADRTEERKVLDNIKKEIKTTKPTGKKKPVGKYTADIQQELDFIREITNLSETRAEEKIEENIKLLNNKEALQDSDRTADEIAKENAILEKYSGTAEQKRDLLNTIIDLKEKGKFSKELKKAREKREIKQKKDEVINRATGGTGVKEAYLKGEPVEKGTLEKAKQYMKAIGNQTVLDWQGLMTVIDQNAPIDVEPLGRKLSTIKQENKYKVLKSKYIDDLGNAIEDIYNIEEAEGLDRIKTRTSKIQSVLSNLTKETVEVGDKEMTRDELIKRYMEIQDETLRESFLEGNEWSEDMFDAIENKISDQDREFAEWQLDKYREMYEVVNDVYRDIYGVDLPFNEFYSPIKRGGVKTEETEVEFLEEAFYRKSVLNKSLYKRKQNLNPIQRQGSLEALDRYMNEASYFTAWAKRVRQFDKIFNDPEVRKALEQEFPDNVMQEIDKKISQFENNAEVTRTNVPILDKFRKNFAISQLAIKPALAAKQMVSSIAYAEDIGFKEFSKGMADFAKNPIENYRTLMEESDFIKERGAGMERDVRAAIKDGAFESFQAKQNLQNKLLTMLKMGDKGAIVAGSWAMRKSLLDQGMELDEVITRYEDFSAQTQQSADFARLSNIQTAGSLAKLFTMFKSAPRAQFQKEVNAIKSLFREGGFSKENIARVGRKLFIYHTLIPTAFQFISNMGGWTEEDKKDYMRAAILGNINGIFIAGDAAEMAVRTALGQHVFGGETFIGDVRRDVLNVMSNIDINEISLEEFAQAADDLVTESPESLAGATGAATGLPAEYAYDVSESIANREFKKAGLEALGWSEYYIDRRGKEEDVEEAQNLDSIIENVRSGGSEEGSNDFEDIINQVKSGEE